MRAPKQPLKAANDLIVLLDTVLGQDRYPLNIRELCLEISRTKYPDHMIKDVKGDDLPGFEGALYGQSRGDKSRWLILYNDQIPQQSRINFTLAHEFGHYLLHRDEMEKFECSQADLADFRDDARRETEANQFASQLLMPPNDFREQVQEYELGFDLIEHCTDRYSVSLTAMLIKYIELTDKRCLLVVSRDGFILWSKPSDKAFRSGKYIKTAGRPPVAVPARSAAANNFSSHRVDIQHDVGVWWPDEPAREITVFSQNYDLVITLLELPDEPPVSYHSDELDESTFDAYDKFEEFNQRMNR